jgi:hypothetical protein
MCIRTDERELELGYFVCGYTSILVRRGGDDLQQSTSVCRGVAHSIGTQSYHYLGKCSLPNTHN